jgi:lipopolysaccharide transport system permease protein
MTDSSLVNPDSARQSRGSEPMVMIRPSSGWVPLSLRDLWSYRELLYFLTWRDVKVRYKQTVLGAAWAVIQPLFMMVVFSIFFGCFAKMPSDGLPYPVFAYCGLLPWQLFSTALNGASTSLVAYERIITKVYFPRLIVPTSAVLASLLDFAISFVVLIVMMLCYGIAPTSAVVALPLFVLLALATALGVGFWLSALNVQYRDVRYVLGFLTQLWLFATPVVYPSSIVPKHLAPLLGLNPMTGVVEGFRWALLGKGQPLGLMLWISAVSVAAVFIGGMYYFRRTERILADVV